MEHIGRQAAALLNAAGIEFGPGLTDTEIDSVHEHFGFASTRTTAVFLPLPYPWILHIRPSYEDIRIQRGSSPLPHQSIIPAVRVIPAASPRRVLADEFPMQ